MTSDSPLISITGPDGNLRMGLHVGALAPVDLRTISHPRHASAAWRKTHHKRWVFVAIAGEHLVVTVAIVHLGYAATAFAYALDRRTRSMLFDRSYFSPAFACHVSDGCEEGCEARFRSPRATISLTRAHGGSVYTLEAQAHELDLRASFDASSAPSPISVVALVVEGSIHITEKRVLMPVRGQMLIGDRFARLDDTVAGFDYTQGFLARRTSWRWAFSMGRTSDGRPIGINLVEGFDGGLENVVWLDGQVVAVPQPRFSHEPDRPLVPWSISTPDRSVDLRFLPDALHEEHRNFGLVRSNFVQPAGALSGTIDLPGQRSATLDSSPGMVEHQDVLW